MRKILVVLIALLLSGVAGAESRKEMLIKAEQQIGKMKKSQLRMLADWVAECAQHSDFDTPFFGERCYFAWIRYDMEYGADSAVDNEISVILKRKLDTSQAAATEVGVIATALHHAIKARFKDFR